jgi:hypothetical protein
MARPNRRSLGGRCLRDDRLCSRSTTSLCLRPPPAGAGAPHWYEGSHPVTTTEPIEQDRQQLLDSLASTAAFAAPA